MELIERVRVVQMSGKSGDRPHALFSASILSQLTKTEKTVSEATAASFSTIDESKSSPVDDL